jgi:hypothetical protein
MTMPDIRLVAAMDGVQRVLGPLEAGPWRAGERLLRRPGAHDRLGAEQFGMLEAQARRARTPMLKPTSNRPSRAAIVRQVASM